MSYLTMYYVQFSLTYLPIQKSDIPYGCSLDAAVVQGHCIFLEFQFIINTFINNI